MGQREARTEPEGHDYDASCRCDGCETLTALYAHQAMHTAPREALHRVRWPR